ncbi:hypothetical protein QYM36_015546 [Artemia franciscana]|uniref:Uncharacterized protein n=1 Tax=Artemia franciscana TaxID=6661 RepID=A0AA88HF95_ARTSF|nr:hypothetical protein QYM36_015546 [Artemia franciscana]
MMTNVFECRNESFEPQDFMATSSSAQTLISEEVEKNTEKAASNLLAASYFKLPKITQSNNPEENMPKNKQRIKIMERVCNISKAVPAIELCKLPKKCYVELLDLMGQKGELGLSGGFKLPKISRSNNPEENMPKYKRRIKIMERVCDILEVIPAIELCKLSKKCYVELMDLMGQKRDLELSAGFWPIYKKDEITESSSAVNDIRPLCKSLSLVLNARKNLDLGSDTGLSAVPLSMDKMSNKSTVEGKLQIPTTFEKEAASNTSSSSIVLNKDFV